VDEKIKHAVETRREQRRYLKDKSRVEKIAIENVLGDISGFRT
jgi:hypothetical protein